MKKLFLILGLTGAFVSQAQTPNYASTDKKYNAVRNSFWFEGNIQGTLKRNKDSAAVWQYQLDYQYRRQSDANYIKDGHHGNIFADPFQQVYRPWIHYWIKPKAVRLSFSPIGFWATWTPRNEGSSALHSGQMYYGEYRICPQITFFQKVGKLEIQQRYRYEFRFISTKDSAKHNGGPADYAQGTDFLQSGMKMRLRYMVRLNYPLNGKSTGTKGSIYLTAWNELFLGIGANTPDAKILDQNRLVLLLGHYLKTKYPVKVELGWTLQYLPKYDINVAAGQSPGAYSYGKLNWEANNALQVYLIFDDFHKFGFNKKKKEEAPVTPVTP